MTLEKPDIRPISVVNGDPPHRTLKTAILYARVSSKAQAERGLSLPGQFRELRAWAESAGYYVVAQIADTGGKDSKRDVLDRPGVNKILDVCERQHVDAVIAQSRDRFGEHPVPDLLAWQLARHDTRLITPDDSGDEDDDGGGELVRLITDWNARRERRTTAKRSRSRKLEHVRKGYVVKSHTAPYGFTFAGTKEERTLEVAPDHMAVVRRIFELIAVEGSSVHGVKKTLDREGVPTPPNPTKRNNPQFGRFWSRQFIRNVVSADVYKPHTREEVTALVAGGYMSKEVASRAPNPCAVWWYTGKDFAGETHRVAVPVPDGGIPREWVDAARDALAGNVQARRRAIHRTYELAGLVYCDLCGRKMQTHTYRKPNGTMFHYYECSSAAERRAECAGAKRIRAEVLEGAVWEFVAGLLSEPERIVAGLDAAIDAERQRLRTDPEREEMRLLEQRAALEVERDGYIRLAARGNIPDSELDGYLADVQEQSGAVDDALRHLRGRGERLRMLTDTRKAYASETTDAWTRETYDGFVAQEKAEGTYEPESEEMRQQQIAMLAGDYAPQRLSAMRRANLDAFGPERRIEQYRKLRLRVDARSKEDITVTGVFGSAGLEVVSGSAPSTTPPTSPTSRSDA